MKAKSRDMSIKMRVFVLALLMIASSNFSFAQHPSPGAEPKKPIVLLGGRLHVGDGTVIESSAVGIEDGKISFVGDASKIRIDRTASDIIDVAGQDIYPGFILPNNVLGIFEIGAVRATRDYAEVGHFKPNARSVIAFNTESKIIPTVRANGVLMTQVTPRNGRISGTSSICHLDGWNWEDAVVREDDGIHFNWPYRYQRTGWWAEPGPTKANEKYGEHIDELRAFMLRAKAYAEKPSAEKNLKMEACIDLFNGNKRMYLHVNDAKSITEAILFAVEIGAKHPVIVGGEQSWMVTDLLKQHNIPVVLERVHSMPDNEDDDIDQPYKTPKMLFDAGVMFCFNYEGDMEAMGARNLAFSAGTAVAYGLPYEEAVKALTSNTAKILGCDDITGVVAEGKQATLFVSQGDALDMRTNNLSHAFIQGRPVDLDNQHKQLYRKYMKKYEQ